MSWTRNLEGLSPYFSASLTPDVTQIVAGTGIGVSPPGGTGVVTVSNTGVLDVVAGGGITVDTTDPTMPVVSAIPALRLDAFSIALNSDLTISPGNILISSWSTSVGDFPSGLLDPGLLFGNDGDYGALNLGAGTYTVGADGYYEFSISICSPASQFLTFIIANGNVLTNILVMCNGQGTGNTAPASYVSNVCKLSSGAVIGLYGNNIDSGSQGFSKEGMVAGTFVYPKLIWSLRMLGTF